MKNNGYDEEMINRLIDSYSSIIRGICRRFYLVGGTDEDLFQEGMIGLLEAVRNFDESRGTIGDENFRKYATTCIRRQIIDAIKGANAKKNQPLNNSVPITRKNDDDAEFEIGEIGVAIDPEEQYILKERQEEKLKQLTANLSKYEVDVLVLYLQGLSIKDIASKLGKTPRSITNCIQRMKNKVKN